MKILLYVIDVLLFLVLFVTLDIVWTNVKVSIKEKDFLNAVKYIIGETAVLAIIIAISSVANYYLQ